jgi:hypothetical protein
MFADKHVSNLLPDFLGAKSLEVAWSIYFLQGWHNIEYRSPLLRVCELASMHVQ